MGAKFFEGPAVAVREDGQIETVGRALHGEVRMFPTGRRVAYAWTALPQRPTPMDLIEAQRQVKAKLLRQFQDGEMGGRDG